VRGGRIQRIPVVALLGFLGGMPPLPDVVDGVARVPAPRPQPAPVPPAESRARIVQGRAAALDAEDRKRMLERKSAQELDLIAKAAERQRKKAARLAVDLARVEAKRLKAGR
jgi:hypothetical protein